MIACFFVDLNFNKPLNLKRNPIPLGINNFTTQFTQNHRNRQMKEIK